MDLPWPTRVETASLLSRERSWKSIQWKLQGLGSPAAPCCTYSMDVFRRFGFLQ